MNTRRLQRNKQYMSGSNKNVVIAKPKHVKQGQYSRPKKVKQKHFINSREEMKFKFLMSFVVHNPLSR